MFYVYELIDPRDGAVFYVGKGKGRRMFYHEYEAKSGGKGPKCERIREILEAGASLILKKVKEFKDEREAYLFEGAHIASIGLENLTNLIPGGIGGFVRRRAQSWRLRDVEKHKDVLIKAINAIRFGRRHIVCGVVDVTEDLRNFIGSIATDVGAEALASVLRPEIELNQVQSR